MPGPNPNISQPGSGSFNLTNPGPPLKQQSVGSINGFSEEWKAYLGLTEWLQQQPPAVQPSTLTTPSATPSSTTSCLVYSSLEQTLTDQRKRTDAYLGNPANKPPLADMSMSEDGDLSTTTRSLLPAGTAIVLNYLTVSATQHNMGNGWLEQTYTAVSSWGWMYASLLDAETGIVGNVAKTFVPNSQANMSGQYLGPTTINGKVFGGLAVGFVEITDSGSDYTSAPTVSFTGGGATTPAAGTAVLGGGEITLITVTNGGSDYTGIPTVTFNGSGGSGATVGTYVFEEGVLLYLIVGNPGQFYPSGTTVSISGGGGTGATATCTVSPIGVASVEITNVGIGYTSAPAVSFSGGGGTGAAGTALLGEDLVVVEFQEYDTLKQILLVTVFSSAQVFGLSETTEIVGDYPVPPQLVGINGYNDLATGSGTGSGDSWQYSVKAEWSGEVAMYFKHPPTKLVGTKVRTYFVGPPPQGEIPAATSLQPASGEIVIRGGEYDVSNSAFANDSGAGDSNSYGQGVRYKIVEVPPCIVDITQVQMPSGSNTNSNSGSSTTISASADFTVNLQSSIPSVWPSTLIEYATAKGRYNLYILDIIAWILP